MRKPLQAFSGSFLRVSLAALLSLAPLHAQTQANRAAPDTTSSAQAPSDMTAKITALVNAGKYTEAQQLTTGLLVAYPGDQRLIKTKALLEKMLAAPVAPGAKPENPQGQAAAGESAALLTGEDKLDYNALIERARDAQQTTDPEQQKALLQLFMGDSTLFLRKHPEQILLWQLRAASAISLNDPDAGYAAARELLAAGAADSNDASLQHLLAQLKNKGWLDQQGVEDFKKYEWIEGTWNVSWSIGERADQNGSGSKEVFSRSQSGDIEGYFFLNGHKNPKPNLRGTIRPSGTSWQEYFLTAEKDSEDPGTHTFLVGEIPGRPYYPSGWQSPISYSLSDDKKTMTMVFPQQSSKRNNKYTAQHPVTLVFEKISDLINQ